MYIRTNNTLIFFKYIIEINWFEEKKSYILTWLVPSDNRGYDGKTGNGSQDVAVSSVIDS